MKGKIIGVYDWKPYCWDVLMDNEEGALASEWSKELNPKEGDDVEYIKGKGMLWKGQVVPVDIRSPRLDEKGNLYFT